MASAASPPRHVDTSIVHSVFGNDETDSTISERDQQIVLAQLQNLVMALRTNAKFRRGQSAFPSGSGMRGATGLSGSSNDLLAPSPAASSPLLGADPLSSGSNGNTSFAATASGGGGHQRSPSLDADGLAPSSTPGAASQHPLVRNAVELRHRLLRPLSGPLSGSSNRRGLTDAVLLAPFLDVMCSSETTEPISAVAMVAVISFLDLGCEFITPAGIVRICDAARSTRGEVMDVQSHDAFLARIIQVFVAAFRHPSAAYVPEELPVTVFQSVMRIGAEAQSELLRRVSEQGMNDIVSACYTHAAATCRAAEEQQAARSAAAAAAAAASTAVAVVSRESLLQPPALDPSVATRFASLLRLICRIIRGDPQIVGRGRSPLAAQLQGLCLAHTALLVLRDGIRRPHFRSILSVVRDELPRALLQVGKRSDHIVVLAQVLRTMHLLFSFASVQLVPQLVSFLCFILRRGGAVLPSASSASLDDGRGGSPEPLHSPQRLSNSSSGTASFAPSGSQTVAGGAGATVGAGGGGAVAPRPRQEELHIESLWEFCSEEAFPAFLMHHVDLSLESAGPLFGPLCQFLAESCVPPGAALLAHVNVLPLDCLLIVLNHMHARVARYIKTMAAASSSSASSSLDIPPPPAVPEYIKAKLHLKGLLDQFIAALAGASPKHAVRAIYTSWSASDRRAFGFSEAAAADPHSALHGADIGRFLYRYRMRLDSNNLCAYVGELGNDKTGYPDEKFGVEARLQWLRDTERDVCRVDSPRFFHELRRGFMASMSFRGKPLLMCLRELCFGFQVSGEAQRIDRIMEEFALQWYEANTDAPREIMPFKGKDAPFILAFSIIMLNTDLHLANMPKKMTRDEFVNRNRLIDEQGHKLPDAYLGGIYDDVKQQQIVFVELLRAAANNKRNAAAAGGAAAAAAGDNGSAAAAAAASSFEEEDADFSWSQEVAEAAQHAQQGAAAVVSMNETDTMLLVKYDSLVLRHFWKPCADGFWRILHIANNVALPVPPAAAGAATSAATTSSSRQPQALHSEDTLREALAYAEQKAAPIELLESVNRGVQSLALTGARLGVHAAPDALVQAVLDTCVLARIDLVNGTAATPYAQVVQLGQKLCPLFQLDTLFRGYLVDVADSLTPGAFTKLAKTLLVLLLCGAFSATDRGGFYTSNEPAGAAASTPSAASLTDVGVAAASAGPDIAEILLQPSVVAAAPAPPSAAAKKRAPAARSSNSGGGVFSFFFGSGGSDSSTGDNDEETPEARAAAAAAARRRAAEEAVEKAALSRLRSALPTLVELFAALDRFSPAALAQLVTALVQVIEDGSLVAPRWKDELVSVGAAFVVEILIQCPSHVTTANTAAASTKPSLPAPRVEGGAAHVDDDDSPASAPSLEMIARSFLERKLDDASRAASSNIIKSILRYAPHAAAAAVAHHQPPARGSAPVSGVSAAATAAARVLKLVSCTQSLSPAAFAPVVRDVLSCIDFHISSASVTVPPASSAQQQKDAAAVVQPLARLVEDRTWCAVLRILRSAARVDEQGGGGSGSSGAKGGADGGSGTSSITRIDSIHSNGGSVNENMGIAAGADGSGNNSPTSPTSFRAYEPRLHALSILGRIVRRRLLPLALSLDAAETAASFSLLDIPATRFVTDVPKPAASSSAAATPSQPHASVWTGFSAASPLLFGSGPDSSPASPAAQRGNGGSVTASGSFVEDQHRPISILSVIHDRLLAAMAATPAAAGSSSAVAPSASSAAMSAADATDMWLRFVVAVTMAMVAAAEHASTHAALELLNALSSFVTAPNLAPAKAVQLLEGALLPVVDRVCTAYSLSGQQQQPSSVTPAAPKASPLSLDTTVGGSSSNGDAASLQQSNNRRRELSMFSPTDLLTYMLGPLAGPEAPSNAAKRGAPSANAAAQGNATNSNGSGSGASGSSAVRHRCADEVKSGVLRLVATTTMHYFDTLAAAQKAFMPLWERVIMSFYAIYSRQGPHEESSDVRETIQFTMVNLVSVTFTMMQSGSGAAFAMHPQLWNKTREMIRRFDFGDTIDADLGKVLGSGSAQ